MRNILLLCALCVALFSAPETISAQTEAPKKDVVVVDLFARDRTVPAPFVDILRRQVIDGFVQRGRHIVVDAQSDPELLQMPYDYGQIDPLQAASQQQDFMRSRVETMRSKGARYLISGVIPKYKFEHVVMRNGKPGFRATFMILISGFDMKLGQEISGQQYTLSGEAPIADDADKMAATQLYSNINYYIDRNYPLETSILGLASKDKKGVLKELYINSGTDIGVRGGDLFLVYEEVPVGGVFIREKVGKLRVTNVNERFAAKCKVTKGGEEIEAAFTKGRGLICISDGKAFFF